MRLLCAASCPPKGSLSVDIRGVFNSPATQRDDGVNVLNLAPRRNRISILKGQQKKVFCRLNREYIEKEEQAKKKGPKSLGDEEHAGQEENEKDAGGQKEGC